MLRLSAVAIVQTTLDVWVRGCPERYRNTVTNSEEQHPGYLDLGLVSQASDE